MSTGNSIVQSASPSWDCFVGTATGKKDQGTVVAAAWTSRTTSVPIGGRHLEVPTSTRWNLSQYAPLYLKARRSRNTARSIDLPGELATSCDTRGLLLRNVPVTAFRGTASFGAGTYVGDGVVNVLHDGNRRALRELVCEDEKIRQIMDVWQSPETFWVEILRQPAGAFSKSTKRVMRKHTEPHAQPPSRSSDWSLLSESRILALLLSNFRWQYLWERRTCDDTLGYLYECRQMVEEMETRRVADAPTLIQPTTSIANNEMRLELQKRLAVLATRGRQPSSQGNVVFLRTQLLAQAKSEPPPEASSHPIKYLPLLLPTYLSLPATVKLSFIIAKRLPL
ncbi:hypothetical protein F5887DRAFT_1163750 [Amanita rubescens]|nr:hypothetical protein F5887DRAFT_1163750 [Amanita rubescens]